MPFRVLTAEFLHESNTFKRGVTDLRAFRHDMLKLGEDAIAARGAANTEIGGFLSTSGFA